MKKLISVAVFCLVLLFCSAPAFATYSESEAFNVAQDIVTKTLEERGCSKLRFAWVDYHMNNKDNRYALYSDVKYVDAKFKNQRDYFVVMFDETDDGVELYMMTLGTEVIFFDNVEQ